MRRKRRRGTRLRGILVAFVLTPSVVPWVPGAGCPHHRGPGGHGAHSAGAPGGAVEGAISGHVGGHGNTTGGHAAHHGGRFPEGHGPDSEPTRTPPPCDCLGQCPVPAGPALPVTHGLLLASQSLVTASSGPSASSRLPFGRAPYMLPFANGPPLS